MASISTCIAASLFGSCGSVIGKLALDSAYTQPISERVVSAIGAASAAIGAPFAPDVLTPYAFYAVRILLVGIMLLCNSVMLNFLVRSMKAMVRVRRSRIFVRFVACASATHYYFFFILPRHRLFTTVSDSLSRSPARARRRQRR